MLSTAFVALGASIVGIGSKFESSMANVAATMGINADKSVSAFLDLENASKRAGETTQFTASQSADALNFLALAGYDTAKAIETLPIVLDLASAGGMDLALASDMLTDSASALGLGVEEVGVLADQMAKTSQKANTSVTQLGEAVMTVGGSAKALVGGTVELNTALGILADNGIKGAEGGTKLRNVIISLSAPTAEARKELETLGISAKDENGNLRELSEIFQDLGASVTGLGTAEKTEALNKIFNRQDTAAVNALLSTSAERWVTLGNEIENSAGSAKSMADTKLDNLEGDVKLLTSASQSLGIALYEKVRDPLREVASAGTKWVGDFTKAINNGQLDKLLLILKTSIVSIGGALAGIATLKTFNHLKTGFTSLIAPVLQYERELKRASGSTTAMNSISMLLASTLKTKELLVGVVTGKIGLATTAQTLWNTAMSANPIGLLVTAGVALVGAITAIALTTKNATSAQEEYVNATSNYLDQVKEQITANTELRENQQSLASGEIAQIDRTKLLNDELQKLTDSNGKVNESNRGRASFILNELNTALGTEYRMIDGTILKYKEMQQEINNIMTARKAEILLESQLPLYREALTNYQNLQIEQSKKLIEMIQLESNVKELQAERDTELEKEKTDRYTATSKIRTLEIAREIEAEKEKYNAIAGTYNESETMLQQYYADIATYEGAYAEFSQGNHEQAVNRINIENSKLKEAKDLLAETEEEKKQILKKQLEEKGVIYSMLLKQMADGNNNITQQMIDDAKRNADHAQKEFEKVGGDIVKGVDKGVNNNKGGLFDTIGGIMNNIANMFKPKEQAGQGRSSMPVNGKGRNIENFSRANTELGGGSNIKTMLSPQNQSNYKYNTNNQTINMTIPTTNLTASEVYNAVRLAQRKGGIYV